jgi:hypothetical protein
MTAPAADVFKGLPRRIQVGQFGFRVLIEPETHEMLTEAFGRCDTTARRIFLRAGMDPALALNTVCHEVTHAVNWVMDLEDGATEEAFTSRHTNGLIDVWMRNPRLFAWISKTLELAKREAGVE